MGLVIVKLPKAGPRWRWCQNAAFVLLAGVFLLGAADRAAALDPTRTIDQFRHTRWTLGDGAPGNIRAIAQGRDGFLWLGTSTGLYRFDGIRFERILPDDDDRIRSLQVTALLVARNGDVWVGYDYGGIGLLRDGHLRNANPWSPLGGVERIIQGRDSAIWVASNSKGNILLSRLFHDRWMRFGPGQGISDVKMGALFSSRDGSVYLASEPAVLRLKPGGTRFEPLAVKNGSLSDMAEDSHGNIWLANENGLRLLGSAKSTIPLSAVTMPQVERQILFDRDGALWISGQDDGLARIAFQAGTPSDRPDLFSERQGLTGPIALSVFEDREGNIWVGTESGLDRFSPSNVVQPRQTEGMVTGFVGGPRSDHVFFAGISGVYRAGGGLAEPELIFRKSSIGVLCGDDRRLLAISMDGAFLLSLTPSGKLEKATTIDGPLSVTCTLDQSGTFWTGMDRVYRLKGTRLEPATGAGGQQIGTVGRLRPDGNGGLIAGRSLLGVQRIQGESATTLWNTEQGLIGATNTFVRVGNLLFQGGQKGLARYDGRQLASLTERVYPYLAGVTGIDLSADGSTWLIGTTGIIRVPTKRLNAAFLHPGTPLDYARFGYEDGFRARSHTLDTNDIVEDSTGRIWFATNRGLAWVDRDQIRRNTLPPNVVILALASGNIRRTPADGVIHLPVGTNRVQIDYIALSLTDAKANRYRYRLEGADQSWVDAGNERQALYTNLGPGTYRFQVAASNNDGVWNSDGAALTFVIAPAFYQTRWFLALCVLAAAGLMWPLYRWRLKTIANRTRHRIEAQMGERERIARELHDTLLQGFQGLMLRFQSVIEQLPAGNGARASLEIALERADDVLMESRERVRTLREEGDPVVLPDLLRSLALPIVHPPTQLRITEEGQSRLVCGPAADEIARIVVEALSNAIHHAQASTLEILIRYASDKLIVAIADDGIGMPPAFRATGRREGHYGLIGMRERAARLAGSLELLSRKPNGTEVRLTVPARIAYP